MSSEKKDLLTYSNAERCQASSWFHHLQQEICNALLALEHQHAKKKDATFETKIWKRAGGGGGQMALLTGNLFEKAGVNVSTVYGDGGDLPNDFPQTPFWASGLSLVIHPRSPHIPAIHMNTRLMCAQHSWFGGGIDLTPTLPCAKETRGFHHHLKRVCDAFDKSYYPRFKEAADTYFFLPHRKKPRGVGGIFYDQLTGPFPRLFAFTQALGEAFVPLYSPLVTDNWHKPWGEKERQAQLEKRAHYAEFNLLYDRGTLFGLKTKGCIDAIFMSLPPLASWPSPLKESGS